MPRVDRAVEEKTRLSTSQATFRFTRFSSAYRSRLLSGIQDVQKFLVQEGGGVKLRTADRGLARYVISRHLDRRGATLSLVKHGLLGCQHLVPQLRGRLATAWENLRVWEEKR